MSKIRYTRKRKKNLGLLELVAVALGGMVGGGIFSILGVSVSMVGAFTPVAIIIGGVFAALAAYAYVKLGVYYQDEGATYSFYKLTFPKSPFRAALIGWWVIFGYISTLALYAYTFSSYALSSSSYAGNEWARKLLAGAVIFLFATINAWSVKGMGKIEDLMVYTKLIILIVISVALANSSETTLPILFKGSLSVSFLSILMVSAITFVAYEGFQLVINAVNEMENPKKNIPRAIYLAIFLAVLIYVIIAVGALLAIPFEDIIKNKEYALAAGAKDVLGNFGNTIVILGAILATSSAISGTIFGASRQMAVIAQDGFFPFPLLLSKRVNKIPIYAILAMSLCAFSLILAGDLEVILEFGSVTFLLVSLLMSLANIKIRVKTESSLVVSWLSAIGLGMGALLILYYEATTQPEQLLFIALLYLVITVAAWLYSRELTSDKRGLGK